MALTKAERDWLLSKNVDPNKASATNVALAKAATSKTTAPTVGGATTTKTTPTVGGATTVRPTTPSTPSTATGTGTSFGKTGGTTASGGATTTGKPEYQDGIMTRDAQGNLTDYGQRLSGQTSYIGAETPQGFDPSKGIYGGVTPTYEAYAAYNERMGNAYMDRAAWENSMGSTGKPYVSSSGSVTSGVAGSYGSTPTITDRSGMIQQASDAATQQAIAQIKEAVRKNIATKEQVKSSAPTVFEPQRAISEVQRGQELRSTLEQSANLGDRGGIGRQAALETQTAADQRLNDINLAQQKIISDANAAIEEANATGDYQTAQAQYQGAQDALAKLLAEKARVEEAQTQAYQYQQSQAQQASQFEQTKAQQQKQFEDTMAFNKAEADRNAAQWKTQFGLTQQEYETEKAQWAAEMAQNKKTQTFNEWLAKQQLGLNKQKAATAAAKKTSGTKKTTTGTSGLAIFYK